MNVGRTERIWSFFCWSRHLFFSCLEHIIVALVTRILCVFEVIEILGCFVFSHVQGLILLFIWNDISRMVRTKGPILITEGFIIQLFIILAIQLRDEAIQHRSWSSKKDKISQAKVLPKNVCATHDLRAEAQLVTRTLDSCVMPTS
jgi:hypothetical protein